MRKALNEQELGAVAGGKYAIDNTDTIYFSTDRVNAYPLIGSRYLAQEIMDGLMGKFATEEAYDQACISALREQGLIS